MIEPRQPRAMTSAASFALALVLAQAGSLARPGVALGQLGREGIGAIEAPAFAESSFLQAIFGDAIRVGSAPDHLDQLLMAAVADIDRHCTLTDEQRGRLILAGRGDAKRFLDQVAAARRVFERLRDDPDGSEEILNAVRPLGARFEAGLFGEGSFFAKALSTTLTPEQWDRRRRSVAEKVRFRYRAKVGLVLASLDPVVGFTSEQQSRYLALILEATRPPSRPAGAYEASVVLCKIAAIPEDRLGPIFDEAQRRALARIFRQARESEPFLKDAGFLD